MNLLSDFLDSVLRFLKLRKTTRAAADAVEGDAIIAQANREAAEMREAAELAEARKRLDTDLSGVPIVAAPSPAPVASVLQPTAFLCYKRTIPRPHACTVVQSSVNGACASL
jgi:hypothetical protein